MQLLIVRHAIAEDKNAFAKTGRPDGERPLTKKGRNEMARVAKGLKRQVKAIDVLAASPLVRAAQTAAIIAEEYDEIFVEPVAALAPERAPAAFASWLRTQRDAEVVVAVGHEPHLGMLVTWLMTGARESHVSLEKGGACMLEVEGQPGARSATLSWCMTPNVMEKLAGK
jgi:phosphohistidine phosphatase